MPPPPPPAAGQQTRQQKQRAFLDHRRKLFLQAALQAKKEGDKAAALEYLRSAKGFEPLLEATENGLPVNMDTVRVRATAGVGTARGFRSLLAPPIRRAFLVIALLRATCVHIRI